MTKGPMKPTNMSPREIQMCVIDVMQDDEIESLSTILSTLNNDSNSSWRMARGCEFTAEEVRDGLEESMAAGLVTPCAERSRLGACSPMLVQEVGEKFSWDEVWFHLERAGREALRSWWEAEGKVRFPLSEQ